MIHKIISQSTGGSNIATTDITTPVNALTPLVDVTSGTILWFTPYLAVEYPEVTCDKKYFFIWGTDHDNSTGGIWWGKGNNLDLSDFEEISATRIVRVDGLYSAETPYLVRFPDETEKIYLYYHTNASEPGNGGVQQTRLITTTGGLLHDTVWTDRGRPLGSEVGDQHTGYLKFWNVDGTFKGLHYKIGSNPPSDIGEWQHSVIASDGLSAVRGDYVNVTTHLTSGRRAIPPYSWVFYLYGQWWWIGMTEVTTSFSFGSPTKGIILCKLNDDLEITEQVVELNGGAIGKLGFYPKVFGFTCHIYIGSLDADPMQYSTYDLTQLQNYI